MHYLNIKDPVITTSQMETQGYTFLHQFLNTKLLIQTAILSVTFLMLALSKFYVISN